MAIITFANKVNVIYFLFFFVCFFVHWLVFQQDYKKTAKAIQIKRRIQEFLLILTL